MSQSKYTIKRAELAKKTKNIAKKKNIIPNITLNNEKSSSSPPEDSCDNQTTNTCDDQDTQISNNTCDTQISNTKTILLVPEEESIPEKNFRINRIGFTDTTPNITDKKPAKISCKATITKKTTSTKETTIITPKNIKKNEKNIKNNEKNKKDEEDEDIVEKDGGEEEDEERDEPVERKKIQVSKECVQLAIKILKKIDPNNQMKKEDVTNILKEYSKSVNDLSIIQAVEYLLDSFDNLEDNFKDLQDKRIEQAQRLKTTEIDKETFKNKISLDSDEREPDENDRIFTMGKNVFSGNNQKYKSYSKQQEKTFASLIQPKKNLSKLKAYGII